MPVQNVKLRATDRMPEEIAKRMTYRTRRMLAADDPQKRQPLSRGEEFEVPTSDARLLYRRPAGLRTSKAGPSLPRGTRRR